MKIPTALLIFAAAAAAYAQEPKTTKADAEAALTTLSANLFSRCHAVYEFTAEMLRSEKPAAAEYTHNMANGARIAALYVLAQEQLRLGKPPQRYGDFDGYVDGISEAEKVRLAALIEAGEFDAVNNALKLCIATASSQEQIMQLVRNDVDKP